MKVAHKFPEKKPIGTLTIEDKEFIMRQAEVIKFMQMVFSTPNSMAIDEFKRLWDKNHPYLMTPNVENTKDVMLSVYYCGLCLDTIKFEGAVNNSSDIAETLVH